MPGRLDQGQPQPAPRVGPRGKQPEPQPPSPRRDPGRFEQSRPQSTFDDWERELPDYRTIRKNPSRTAQVPSPQEDPRGGALPEEGVG
eukprot:539265-Pyramimonas_sp.AAC.1